MKIFLDDERPCPEGWSLFKNAEDLIYFWDDDGDPRSRVEIEAVSLDHDLGEGRKTGYDVLLWLEEVVHDDPTFPIPEITVHSANPTGRANMMRALESIKRIRQAQMQE